MEKWDTDERSGRGIDGIEPNTSWATPPLESSDWLNGCAVREPPFLRTSSRATSGNSPSVIGAQPSCLLGPDRAAVTLRVIVVRSPDTWRRWVRVEIEDALS